MSNNVQQYLDENHNCTNCGGRIKIDTQEVERDKTSEWWHWEGHCVKCGVEFDGDYGGSLQ